MVQNLITKHEIKDHLFYMHIDLPMTIENVEENLVVAAGATVAFFLQKVKYELTVGGNDIYYKDDIVATVSLSPKHVDVMFYTDRLKKMDAKFNPIVAAIGLKAYYNIYYNLYQNNEYYKIEEYFQTIKRGE